MTWPERQVPDGAGHDRLRASHAERDRVVNTLKSAYVLGFVTKDEFDVRVSRTLAARTYADLAVVTSDLPASLAAVPVPHERALAKARATMRPVDRAIVACSLIAAVACAAAIVSDDGWLALGALMSALATFMLVARQMRTARRSRPPSAHRPGPGAMGKASTAAAAVPNSEPRGAIGRGRTEDVRPPRQRRPRPLLSS